MFIPAANKQVLAVIVKKGTPHPKEQHVFWARVEHDGHIVVKSKRLPASDFNPPRREPNQLDEVLPKLKSFVASPDAVRVNEPEFCKTAPINFDDPLLELVPEAYIDSRAPTTAEIQLAVDEMARETVSFMVKFKKEHDADRFDEEN